MDVQVTLFKLSMEPENANNKLQNTINLHWQ
jgi:hypothetical protein